MAGAAQGGTHATEIATQPMCQYTPTLCGIPYDSDEEHVVDNRNPTCEACLAALGARKADHEH